jgi:hypothetical protein
MKIQVVGPPPQKPHEPRHNFHINPLPFLEIGILGPEKHMLSL